MDDIWRLSASDLTLKIKARKISAREAMKAALTRLGGQSRNQRSYLMSNASGRRGRRDNRQRQRSRPARRRADHGEGQCRSGGIADNQRRETAARSDCEIQPCRGQSAQGRCCDSRPHQLPGVFVPLVHHQSDARRYQKIRAILRSPGLSSSRVMLPGAAVASGIGHIAHGTDIAGSIRYPAYACGVHGLRPTIEYSAFNASLPE